MCVLSRVIVFAARTAAAGAACPECGHLSEMLSEMVHRCYPRTLQDLPGQGNAVRIAPTLRRFFCDKRECPHCIFAERLPAVTERYARYICPLADALPALTYLMGG